jgi:hypothetical protein
MRIVFQLKLAALTICVSLCSLHVAAQETPAADTAQDSQQPAAITKVDSSATTEPKSDVGKPPANKKMVQDATISLQTTITGNQEQPKVLYILPWQSPQTESVDFEPLDNQQKALFNHVERDELRRELETAEELQ